MLEKDLYPKLSKIIRDNLNLFTHSSAFELKVARGKKFYKRQLETHQERALKMVTTNNGVYHKISDQSINSKPFDSFLLKGDGYVVIYFEESKMWYFIHINTYIEIKETSLTEERCREVSMLTTS